MKEMIQTTFDYSTLDTETTDYLKQSAQETRVLLKRTTEDIIGIGQNLLEAKKRLLHGQFTPWIKAEFGISQPTAWRFMQVAQGKPLKSFKVNDFIPQIEADQESAPVAESVDIDTDQCSVYHCSVAELQNHVRSDSLDAIITDPPYGREHLETYSDLAKFAAYALKPGGLLVAMVGQYHLLDIGNRLSEHLTYHWQCCYYTPGDTTKVWRRHIGASWKPLLCFVKGEYAGPWAKDVVFVGELKDKQYHGWGQPVDDMVNIIDHFTRPDHFVCDPFLGGGTTAIAAMQCERHFVGCDIDLQCVAMTKQRVSEALIKDTING